MNIIIFSQRLQECRKRKYSSQQAFADAYMKAFGMIRKPRSSVYNNMFGTIQSWEQGKSTPTAEALANICELLDCDADYLLGRIDQRTHDITDAHRYTGLSPAALEQLHEYKENLAKPDWAEIRELDENWLSHKYYQAYGLYLIDELLTGSEHHKLNAGVLEHIYSAIIYDGGFGVTPEEHGDADDYESPEDDQRELYAAQDREKIDLNTYLITTNIRDILVENASQNKLPPALALITERDNVTYAGIDNED